MEKENKKTSTEINKEREAEETRRDSFRNASKIILNYSRKYKLRKSETKTILDLFIDIVNLEIYSKLEPPEARKETEGFVRCYINGLKYIKKGSIFKNSDGDILEILSVEKVSKGFSIYFLKNGLKAPSVFDTISLFKKLLTGELVRVKK
jgi:hypothetical protein